MAEFPSSQRQASLARAGDPAASGGSFWDAAIPYTRSELLGTAVSGSFLANRAN